MPTRKEQANSSRSTRKEARSPLFQSRLCSSCICRMSAPEEQDSGVKLGTCCADHAIQEFCSDAKPLKFKPVLNCVSLCFCSFSYFCLLLDFVIQHSLSHATHLTIWSLIDATFPELRPLWPLRRRPMKYSCNLVFSCMGSDFGLICFLSTTKQVSRRSSPRIATPHRHALVSQDISTSLRLAAQV